MGRDERFLWGMFVVVIILCILGLWFDAYSAHAQEDIHPNTWFEQGCIEALDETHYRLHFHYTSDGVEQFHFYIGAVEGSNVETLPYSGHATTNIPDTFVTVVGYHDDWYLEGESADSPYIFHLMFQNDVGVADLPISTWDAPEWCEAGQYAPIPTPMPTNTPPLDKNAGNGQLDPSTVGVVMSTGRTCVVKYPQIILVCHD